MTDDSQSIQSDQSVPQVHSSYADHYAPPADSPVSMSGWSAEPSEPTVPTSSPTPTPAAAQAAPSTPNIASPNLAIPDEKISQTLEDQNIFTLLGIEEATDEEKEDFLDELQQVIWEDFLEKDVELLLTEEEMVDFKKIADKQDLPEEERQIQMVEFLEKLIPDLEKIMLEKALELKEEFMRNRITDLLENNKENPETLAKVKHALTLVDDQQWRAAADELNAINTTKMH